MIENGLILAEAYVPPNPEDMHLPPFFTIGDFAFGKQNVLVLLSVVIISVFFLTAARKRAMVPGKTQFIAESGYMFARNSLGKETLGVQHYKPFVPILFASFFFVLVNNLYGSIPFVQLPSFSHSGSAYALAGVAYLTWVGVGIKRKGLGGFFKDITMPSGLPVWIYPILIPIEFFSNLLIRPATHALRLFATMFGGHLALMVASSMVTYMVETLGGIGYLAAIAPGALGIFLYFLEFMIQCIQAYVFALLLAVYLQGSVSEGH